MKPPRYTEWSPPAGLVLQPGALLVPGRVGYTTAPEFGEPTALRLHRYQHDDDEGSLVESGERWAAGWSVHPGRPTPTVRFGSERLDLEPVSVPHWDLSGLTGDELDGLREAVRAEVLRRNADAADSAMRDVAMYGSATIEFEVEWSAEWPRSPGWYMTRRGGVEMVTRLDAHGVGHRGTLMFNDGAFDDLFWGPRIPEPRGAAQEVEP